MEADIIKKSTAGVWVTAAVIILTVLFFTIFGLPFTSSDGSGGIILPDDELASIGVDLDRYSSNLDMLKSVEIGKHNIKQVISALQRPEKYHISANSTVYYSGGQGSVSAEGYVLGQVSRAISYDDSGMPQQHCLIDGGTVYLWGEGSSSYYSGSKGSFSEDDYVYIPTYEKILALEDENILSADYSLYNEMYCLVAEALDEMSGYRSLYYISVENGLLIGAQSFEGDSLVYSLSCDVLQFPDTYGNLFSLPDGTAIVMEGR